MNFVLDTCVLSETIKPKPDMGLIAWLRGQKPDSLFLSAISLGELRKAVDRLPTGKKKRGLLLWLTGMINEYDGRFLDFDTECALRWGSLTASLEAAGTPMPVLDSMIAACALRHGYTLVTRNDRDYRNSGVLLLNPWKIASIR